MTHEAVSNIAVNATQNWVFPIDTATLPSYFDNYLLLMFGGIPWQVIYNYITKIVYNKSIW